MMDQRTKAVGTTLGVLATGASIAGGIGWFIGSENPETPAGYVGYVTQSPVFGESKFIKLQTGPASPGRHWMYDVKNISITPYSYDEDFPLDRAPLSKDGLPIQFHLATIWRVNPEKAQQFVEHFTTLDEVNGTVRLEQIAFDDFMKQPIRSMALDEIHQRGYMDVATELVKINESLLARARTYAADTPFEILGVAVGNVQFPQEVKSAVANRLAKQQELERMSTELEITRKKAEQRIVEAEGIAKSQEIIAGTLTPQYLAHEAIESQKLLRDSPNHSVVYIPTNDMGVPILTTDALKPTSTPAVPPSSEVAK